MQYILATMVVKSKAPGSAEPPAEPSVEFTEPARFGRARFLPARSFTSSRLENAQGGYQHFQAQAYLNM